MSSINAYVDSSNYTVGRLSAGRVMGREGLGIYCIYFDVEFVELQSPVEDKALEIYGLESRISVKIGKRKTIPLGRGYPVRPVNFSIQNYPDSRSTLVAIDLSPAQIFQLEGIRNGGGLEFEVQVYFQVNLEREVQRNNRLTFDVSQGDWLKVLKGSGYGEYLLFEVPVPSEKSPTALREAVSHLKKAQKRHMRGEYNDCVQELRKVYESIRDERDESSKIRTANQKYRGSQDSRKAMDASERRLALREAARHVTHIPNHAGGDYHYSRRESRMYLGVAASILSYYLDTFGDEG